MKLHFLLWFIILQSKYSHACAAGSVAYTEILTLLSKINSTPLCMSVPELYVAIKMICEQEIKNASLWSSIIQCHRPIDDDFLRNSGEALCPISKRVEDPTDTSYSIEKVFFNICRSAEGNKTQITDMANCVTYGDESKNILPHNDEVAMVKSKWGTQVPCDIGLCIKKVLGYM